MSTPKNLQEWLEWQESLHLTAIDLGLERVRAVAGRLGILHPAFPLITVAGTNGKGSTVAFLTAMLQAAGYRTGVYTSPHILRYNERVAVDGSPVDDGSLCEAFAAIDQARGDISLTYFEFGTLAAMLVFMHAAVDVAVLEVGLGGRLDATNVWDADAAIITGIGIDHVDWLGKDRESIGREKAGIARGGRPLICTDPEPPVSIAAVAQEVGAVLQQQGVDFRIDARPDGFDVCRLAGEVSCWRGLPVPGLQGAVQLRNAAGALLALDNLRQRLPQVSPAAIREGIRHASVMGRLQQLQSAPDVWIDVAHNPDAAEKLADWLEKNPVGGKTYAIFSILADKDIAGVIRPLTVFITEWHIFPLVSSRATPLSAIKAALNAAPVRHEPVVHADAAAAWSALKTRLETNDRVVIFGSFLVVSNMLGDVFEVH